MLDTHTSVTLGTLSTLLGNVWVRKPADAILRILLNTTQHGRSNLQMTGIIGLSRLQSVGGDLETRDHQTQKQDQDGLKLVIHSSAQAL